MDGWIVAKRLELEKTNVPKHVPGYGGDSSAVCGVLSGVASLAASFAAFAALKRDGSVVTWGSASSWTRRTVFLVAPRKMIQAPKGVPFYFQLNNQNTFVDGGTELGGVQVRKTHLFIGCRGIG